MKIRKQTFLVLVKRSGNKCILTIFLLAGFQAFLWLYSKGFAPVDVNLALKNDLEIAKTEIQHLREENHKLKQKLLQKGDIVPSAGYERHRKRLRSNIQNLWEYTESILKTLKLFEEDQSPLKQLSNMIYQHKLFLLSDLEQMTKFDGFENWRRKELKNLEQIVQNRLQNLQNPINCENSDIVKCELNQFACGWGCQVHHLAECLAGAYGFQRILLMNSTESYYGKVKLSSILNPLSNNCNLEMYNGQKEMFWTPATDKYPKILNLPDTVKLSRPRLKYLPSAVPADLFERLSKLDVEPSAWWVGQLKKFILRFTPEVQNKIEEICKKLELNFNSPIVGIHVRRTDKVRTNESLSYSVDAYMNWAEQYFDQLNLTENLKKRRIFLASEDPSVAKEIQDKFPEYEIVTNTEASQLAEQPDSRYSIEALLGIITDVTLLSKTDFVVCTFSSNVGRLVYELMQTERPDARFRVKSLDFRYNNYAENDRIYKVLMSHVQQYPGEANLKMGKQVSVSYSQNSNGTLLVLTDNWKIAPAFKLEEIPEIVQFP